MLKEKLFSYIQEAQPVNIKQQQTDILSPTE